MATTDFDILEKISSIEKEKEKQKTQEPNMFRVVLHNDDKTTVDFVITLLQMVFHKDLEEAAEITLSIHHKGRGIAGIYTREIAEEKTEEAIRLARTSGYPLQVTYEKI
jgi:ATP-dependent Clp protease adaptor protein ClpS